MSALAAAVEEVAGRSDPEKTLPDPSVVFNYNERDDARLAEEREVHQLRMLLCGKVAIFVRPLGGGVKNSKKTWPEQVGLATWCGTNAGKAALAGKRVVELGATLGLCGAAASFSGVFYLSTRPPVSRMRGKDECRPDRYHERLGDCDECCLTAFGEATVANLQRDDANNGCRVARLNWYDFGGDDGNALDGAAAATLADIGPVDVALGANVVDHENGARLARVINHLACANAGFVAFVLHRRASGYLRRDFLPEVERLGLAVDTRPCADLEAPLVNNLEMRGVDWGAYVRLAITRPPGAPVMPAVAYDAVATPKARA